MKSQTQATITTKIKIYGPTKKQHSKKTTVQHAHKWKPKNDPTDSNNSDSSNPEPVPHRKCTKQSADNEMDAADDEPEVVISLVSGSGGDDTTSSSDKVWHSTYFMALRLICQQGWWAGDTTPYRLPAPMEVPTKKGLANDLCLIFTDSVMVKFV